MLRLLQQVICSAIRVAAEPRTLCHRLGITEEVYTGIMAENQHERVCRLVEMLQKDLEDSMYDWDGEGGCSLHMPGCESFAARLARDGEAMVAITGLSITDLRLLDYVVYAMTGS